MPGRLGIQEKGSAWFVVMVDFCQSPRGHSIRSVKHTYLSVDITKQKESKTSKTSLGDELKWM